MAAPRNTVSKPPGKANRGHNRAPLKSELSTLRELHTYNRRSVVALEEQLAQAKQARDNMRNRYEIALREVESLESALSASDNLVAVLQRQCDELSAEGDQLAELIHPIRQLNIDVLQTIFEWTVELTSSQTRIETALRLSHVCQSWKMVALSTQTLWNCIDISIMKEIPFTMSRIHFVALRLRSMPPQITLRDIGKSPNRSSRTLRKLLEAVNLDRFKSVKSIHVLLASSSAVVQLDQAFFKYSRGPLEHLTLQSTYQSPDSPIWNYAPLLGRLPTLQRLSCINLGALVLGGDRPFSGIKAISLNNILIPTLPSQLSRFNNLETLHISGEEFQMDPIEEDIILHGITDLYIDDAHGFPWSKFNAPQLRKVAIEEMTEEAIDFLCRHPSIRSLDPFERLTGDQFRALSTSLPDLESLAIGGVVDKFFPQGRQKDTRPFPNLKHLYLDMIGCSISLDAFERFIRSRCLAQKIKKGSNRPQRLKSFTIDDTAAHFDDSGFENSRLLESCTYTRRDWKCQGQEIVTFNMKWLD